MDKKGQPQEKKCKAYVKGYDKGRTEFNLGKTKINLSEFINQTNVPLTCLMADAAIDGSTVSFSLSI